MNHTGGVLDRHTVYFGEGGSEYDGTLGMNAMVEKKGTEFRWKEYLCRNKLFTRVIILHCTCWTYSLLLL